MFEKKFWENQLKNLDLNDLNELSKLINKFKKEVDKRPEFLNVLKEWQKKYPDAKIFYCGGAGKGAYECEGEWHTYDWTDCRDTTYRTLFKFKEVYGPGDEEYENGGNVELIEKFNNIEEFKNACLNSYILSKTSEHNKFEKELRNAKHTPHYGLEDAEDLYNGDTFYEFINIETGETYCLYYNAY